MTDWEALESAWSPARAAGVLGPLSLDELRDHAAGYVPAALRVPVSARAVDLGTGAGVPGLLLAVDHPGMRWTLVDASARRCSMAESACAALGLGDRVAVVHARAEELAHRADWRGEFDLVVARSFGDAAELAECGVPLLRPGGVLVVSVTSETALRWNDADLEPLGATVEDCWTTPAGRYLAVRRRAIGELPAGDRYPRRPAARRRRPLF